MHKPSMKSRSVLIVATCFSAIVGYVAPSVADDSSSDGQTAASTRRPSCNYGFTYETNSYTYVPRFYQETKREAGLGEPIKDGSILFYAQYAETEKFAVADEQVENRDKSPLTRNWTWRGGAELPVGGMVTTDNRNWWYLVFSGSYGYWTADESGMLCGNVLSFDHGKITTGKGMSDVYQSKPIRFTERVKYGVPHISVSVSVKKVTGATATLEINAMKNGRAVYTSNETVDLIGGEFQAGKMRFITERNAGQTSVKSVSVPDQVALWLHSDLKIRENAR